MSDDVNDFLMSGGGAKSAFNKTSPIGSYVKGTILSSGKQQQTEPGGKLKTYDNGDPAWQVVAILQTDERDDTIPDDDGRRAVYIKGQMLAAVRDAIKAAGETGFEVGGTLAVKFIGTKPSQTKGYSDQKLFEAGYKAPALAGSDLLADVNHSSPSVAELV